jgi:phage terminase large subunit GpA-like protein
MIVAERTYSTADPVALANRLLAGLRRPPRVKVSEWADQYRRLPSKGAAEPGLWRTSRVPYLREIMDVLSAEHPTRRVVFMKSVQSGGTEAGNNWVGWFLGTQRAPMMVVQPTLDLAERWSKQRLAAMIEETPELRALVRPARERDSGNTTLLKEFPGGVLVIAGANSGAGLRSMPVRYLMLDEIDAYPIELEGEGDPIQLAQARTTTFPRRKVLLISTPTIESLSRINREWLASDMRRYHVACPECGHFQPLVWDNLTWDKGQYDTVRYACGECGALVPEHRKTAMLAGGVWVAEHPERESVGFHINALYTPVGLGLSWPELAQEWEAAQRDPQKLKAFENLRLGQVTRDPSEKLDYEEIASRAELHRKVREIPAGVVCLTAGIDVQKDRWAVLILGWHRHGVAVIDWAEIPGDPSQPAEWAKLEAHVGQPIANARGVPMRVEMSGVDSGYLQDDVMYFVRPRQRRGWFAIKGNAQSGRPIITRASRIDFTWRGQTIRSGAEQWPVGVYAAKEWIFTRLAGDRDRSQEERAVRFPAELGEAFYSQLTAEVFDSTKRRFVSIRPRNEALDTFCYALAAAQHPLIRVHTWRDPQWTQREAIYEPAEGDLFASKPPAAAETQAPAPPMPPNADIETMIAAARARLGA